MISWQGKLLNIIIHFIAKIDRSSLPFDIVKRRHRIEKIAKYFNSGKGIKTERINIKHISAEWLYSSGFTKKVILYLHGGAFVIGSTDTHRSIISKIAQLTSFFVLAINYRLAPEHPFPASIEDVVLAYEWLLQQGILPENVIIAGDSSGGNLALATVLILRDKKMPLPAAIACLSPWVDLTLSGESISTNSKNDPLLKKEIGELVIRNYLQNERPESPLASPLFADLKQLPPLYIQVSDTEVLYSDAVRLAEKARLAGVKVKLQVFNQMMHSWQFAHAWVPEAKQALIDLAQFILNSNAKDSQD